MVLIKKIRAHRQNNHNYPDGFYNVESRGYYEGNAKLHFIFPTLFISISAFSCFSLLGVSRHNLPIENGFV